MTTSAQFTLSELLKVTQGKLIGPQQTVDAFTLNTDTRTIQAGQWFIPLVGANFDGHAYVAEASAKAIAGALVNESLVSQHPDWQAFPNIVAVPDTLQAYMALAQAHRRRVNPKLKVVGLTGSSGKTTTKDMLFAAFSGIQPTQKTQANFNNEIGVSQTLLALQPETEIAIVEMGMRGPHQIDILSLCAEPDVAVITNVGPAHIEMLGSLEAIAAAKLEIVDGLKGELVVNGDDPQLNQWTPKRWSGLVKKFTLAEASAIQPAGEGQTFKYQGQDVTLAVPGKHNIMNAMSVLKVGEALGLPLDKMIEGLARFQPEGGRWNKQPIEGLDNVFVINDAYNANPDSCRASLTAFFEWPTPGLRRVLVLGGMKELGPFSEKYHRELGEWLTKAAALDMLITVGDEAQTTQAAIKAKGFQSQHCDTVEDALTIIRHQPLKDRIIFLKGSRAYGLEKIVSGLTTSHIK